MSDRFFIIRMQTKFRNYFLIIFLILIVLLTGGLSCKGRQSSQDLDSFRMLLARFETPPLDYRPAVRWVWNGRITPEEIEFQLDEFVDNGFGMLIISTDKEQSPPSASKLWQDLVLFAISHADSLGLEIRIVPGCDSLLEMKGSPPEISERIRTGADRLCLWNNSFGDLAARRAVSKAVRSDLSVITAELDDFQEESFAAFKSVSDRAFALGFNSLCYSPAPYSIHGVPKSRGPNFSYYSSWWELFLPFSDYIARTSMAMCMGTPVHPILVLDPVTRERRFEDFLDTLNRFNLEYELAEASEIMDSGRAKGGRFILGSRNYSALVIPPQDQNFSPEMMGRIKELTRSGIRIVCFSNRSDAITPAQFPIGCVFQALTDSVSELLRPDGFRLIPGRPEDHLMHHRRKLTDGELLVLVNLSDKEPVKGKIRMAGETVFRLDAFTGMIEKYPTVCTDSCLDMDFELPAAGTLLLCSVVTDTFGFHSASARPETGSQTLGSEGPLKIIPSYFNSLTLDRCYLILGGKKQKIRPVSGSLEIDQKGENLEIGYAFDMNRQVDTSTLMVVVEEAEKFTVKLNGRLQEPMKDAWLIDRGFGVYEIASAVPGQNELVLVPRTGKFEIPPVYIYGDFSLIPSSGTWIMGPLRNPELKPWKDQGMPFYSDAMAYISAYRIEKVPGQYQLILGRWNGSVAEVRINDVPAGIIGWPPNSLDVTAKIVNGLNHVEVNVYGTLENSLLCFRDTPDSGHPDFIPYGLFEKFKLRFTPAAAAQN